MKTLEKISSIGSAPTSWSKTVESTDQQALWRTLIKESFFQLQRDIDVLQRWQEGTKSRQLKERRKRARSLTLGRARAQNALYIRRRIISGTEHDYRLY